MAYVAVNLAKYIVSKCMNENCPISNLQLQKILYYIQREYLRSDSIAFYEPIEAWQFGPVVPGVYYHFCGSGAMPIAITYDNVDIDSSDATIIDPLVNWKRSMEPWELVAETHKPGGAWAQTYCSGEGNRRVIPTSLIKEVG